jgi:hypothetical protein
MWLILQQIQNIVFPPPERWDVDRITKGDLWPLICTSAHWKANR